jgi:hypothetical protein
MEFRKVLARYYHGWFRDCHDSAVYCEQRGQHEAAEAYLADAKKYLEVILNNYDAIEFFSIGDNAFKYDAALPEQFRGYR